MYKILINRIEKWLWTSVCLIKFSYKGSINFLYLIFTKIFLFTFERCQEKTNMEAVMKENMNRYMPGMVIHEDGSIEAYEVSPEEIDIVMEIVDIIKE